MDEFSVAHLSANRHTGTLSTAVDLVVIPELESQPRRLRIPLKSHSSLLGLLEVSRLVKLAISQEF